MEDRYEIRGKIGQGGLGAVYRGFDTRMKREVAIKRIPRIEGDSKLQEESTRQLLQEAGALASLQHPNIVTIYDVGTDEDGPYVVMELITGNTLDELIERAPLTWPDFREMALQTQEALIAAQELDLIHSDIKPSNLMLTWLPSGKFQIKIVDFGLATLTKSQSREELQQLEAVFGSIFFMAPEQFERVPLDARSDLYSMGCVYYHALAGMYPFNGKTGQEVMQAHLHHSVQPLQEVRADIPLWACDWIMWHLNRHPQDRPESARDALTVFLQNDKNPTPTMSLGGQESTNEPKRPRLIIPGAESVPVHVTTAKTGALARTSTAETRLPAAPTAIVVPMPPANQGEAAAAQIGEPVKTVTAPQPLMPPEGSKPSVHTSAQELPPHEPEPQPLYQPKPAAPLHVVPASRPAMPKMPVAKKTRQKLSNAHKTTIAAVLGLMVVLLGWYLLDRSGKNRLTRIYNEKINLAANPAATEVPVDAESLGLLLNAATRTGMLEARQTVYQALYLAKATDGTDIDARIAGFATDNEMLADVREVLIRDVLRRRKNPSVVPTLLDYASRPGLEPRFAVAALQAIRFMAGDEQVPRLSAIMQTTGNDEVRRAAEETMAEIIKKSPRSGQLADPFIDAYQAGTNDIVRHALLRLIGRCGGDKALELVKKALDEPRDRVAAIATIGSWKDDGALPLIYAFIKGSEDMQLRSRAFDAVARFSTENGESLSADAIRGMWQEMASLAKTTEEQIKVISALIQHDADWSVKLLEQYRDSDNDRAADLADRGLREMEEQRKLRDQDDGE
jgi:serine/threonine protein kinase